MPTILVAADICPIERNRPLFMAGDAHALFGELHNDFLAADLAIANLECPLIEVPSPIQKTGPTFGEPLHCIRGIKEAGISVLALANNHIMDHGEAGLRSTLHVCNGAGLATVGAGAHLAEAARVLVREVGDCRIGMIAMAEHEFSIATPSSAGANPLDLMTFVRTVRRHRDELDYLLVLLHGGHEFCPWPSPRIRETCRFLVEEGADFVAVQHPHCLGGYETYRGGQIVYGQGALIMDEAIYRDLESFHEGYVVKLTIEKRKSATMEFTPFRQSEEQCGAQKMPGRKAESFLGSLAGKSELIQDDVFLEDQWVKFCETQRHGLLSTALGHGRVIRKLNALTAGLLVRGVYGRRALLGLQNVIACETHREIMTTLLCPDDRERIVR